MMTETNGRAVELRKGDAMKAQTGLELKYFVLNPSKRDAYGVASRKALLAYAESIRKTNPALSYELCQWEMSIVHKFNEEDVLARARGETPEPRADVKSPME